MRTMGLDLGEKTIGVAISDELGWTAQGVTTVRRSKPSADFLALEKLASEREVARVVIGLPLHLDGREGPEAVRARKFGEAVSKRLGLPVEFWDERLSTVAAEKALLEGDASRAKRRKVIDQVAATLILQGWLDAQRGGVGRTSEAEAPE